jgi:HCOMODA/2-hydroxy-3-carboxy-muconic semialdehyde decarboxylase
MRTHLKEYAVCAGVALVSAASLIAQSNRDPDARDPALIAELVMANHILSNEGVVDAYGHVSIRDPHNANHYWMARGVAAGTVTPASIGEYDLSSNPLVGDVPAGFIERFIHGEIYKARPDVVAIVHCHSADIIPFSVSNVPLRPISHMAGFLENAVPIFEIRNAGGITDMLIRTPTLGKALAQTLGDKPAALMRGHGAVVVGPNLHMTVGRAYYLNFNARLQSQAILLGGTVTYLEPEEARKAAVPNDFERAWALWKQVAEQKAGQNALPAR